MEDPRPGGQVVAASLALCDYVMCASLHRSLPHARECDFCGSWEPFGNFVRENPDWRSPLGLWKLEKLGTFGLLRQRVTPPSEKSENCQTEKLNSVRAQPWKSISRWSYARPDGACQHFARRRGRAPEGRRGALGWGSSSILKSSHPRTYQFGRKKLPYGS